MKRRTRVQLSAAVAACLGAAGGSQAIPLLGGPLAQAAVSDGAAFPINGPIPVSAAAADRQPRQLRNSVDVQLQQSLESLVDSPPLRRAIEEQRFAAALVDITDLDQPRLAAINSDLMMYAASLPKIAILLGVFQQAENGELVLDDETLDSATRMIRNSSNSAATAMYEAVDPAALAEILQSPRYRLYDPRYGGGLWVGKPYAKQQTWRRDPIANLSHGATAFQVARFFYLLERGELVSADSAARMKAILGFPAIAHKFVQGLRAARPGSRIFRKSGTWRTYHADAGIVERDGRRYIAVMLANDPRGGEWLSRLIVGFDDLIHQGRSAVNVP